MSFRLLKKKALSKIFQLINSCKIHKINKIIIPLVDNSSLKNKNEENITVKFF